MDSKANHICRRHVRVDEFDELEENLKELQVLELKWGKMRADLARKLLEEQDTVFRRYYDAKWGNGDGGTGRASAGGSVVSFRRV